MNQFFPHLFLNDPAAIAASAPSKNAQSVEAGYQALIENVADWIVVVDLTGRILFHNRSSRYLVGYEQEALTGQYLWRFIHADDLASLKQTVRYLNRHHHVHSMGETRFRHQDGQWRVLEINARALGGSPDRVIINARDVSSRCAMEAELRDAKRKAELANHAKTLFVANASHEIRTSMHAMLAMAAMLRDTALSEQQQRYMHSLVHAGEHLTSLLGDLLDLSRVESGRLHLSKAVFHLSELMQNVVDVMAVQAVSKGLGLHCEVDDDVADWRWGDAQRLRQIVINLVSNAIKFTDRGNIYITIASMDVDTIVLSVRDSGCGIAKDQLSLVFDAFQQAEGGSGPAVQGTGLGLAICKGLAEAMEGSIRVASQLGQGSTFTCLLNLPVSKAPLSDLSLPDSPLPLSPLLPDAPIPHGHLSDVDWSNIHWPNAKILVADDLPANRMVMQEFLSPHVGRVDVASNGQEAIRCLDRMGYDLVLMDMRMPVQDGWSALRAIRHREHEQNRVATPVIALTAGVMAEDRQRAMQAGCNDYLSKPVGKPELMRAVSRFLCGAIEAVHVA